MNNNAGEESDENPYTECMDNEIQVIQEGSNQINQNKHILLDAEDDDLT
jgi:hypothetical protein